METKNIRNIALLGHGNSGKTSLAESMLYVTGAIDRLGKVADGNTVCDYDAEEIARQITISTAIAPVEYAGSKNRGRGTYYDDICYTPTWREYRYDQLPAMNNLALYAEEKLSIPTTRLSTFELTAGLRDDITVIGGSDYGTVSSLSPRVNSRYVFWRRLRKRWVNELVLHAGWGKSVKLPSFQVLYPSPSYADRLAFASTSTADNTSHR